MKNKHRQRQLYMIGALCSTVLADEIVNRNRKLVLKSILTQMEELRELGNTTNILLTEDEIFSSGFTLGKIIKLLKQDVLEQEDICNCLLCQLRRKIMQPKRRSAFD